jgi:hypothetical protein
MMVKSHLLCQLSYRCVRKFAIFDCRFLISANGANARREVLPAKRDLQSEYRDTTKSRPGYDAG